MDADRRLWVALDTDWERTLHLVREIGEANLSVVRGFKLNRTLDQQHFRPKDERRMLEEILDVGVSAWADLKLHDVSRTVAARIEPYVESSLVRFITVMAKGEVDMMLDAVEAAGEKVSVIAVTELTSLTEELVHLGSGHPAKASVINLARLAVLAGVEYLVCSGQELSAIRQRRELRSLKPFVPGVNPSFASAGSDQSRTMSIVDALRGGADAVVVGSTIANAENPVDVITRIAAEIEEAPEMGPEG